MKFYLNWIINEVAKAMKKGDHAYIRTGQTLYLLQNFVVQGDNYAIKIKLLEDLFQGQ